MNVRGIAPGWSQAGVKGVGSPYPPGAGTQLQISSSAQWWIPEVSSPPPCGSRLQHSLTLTPHILHPTLDLQQPKISNLLPLTPFSAFLPV